MDEYQLTELEKSTLPTMYHDTISDEVRSVGPQAGTGGGIPLGDYNVEVEHGAPNRILSTPFNLVVG
jgi:hypothetical protein